MVPKKISDYLTVTQAAKRAGVGPDTIRRWCNEGLSHIELGPRTKAILPDDLDAYARMMREWRKHNPQPTRRTKYISRATELNDRPLLPEWQIKANRAKLARNMAKKKKPIVLGLGEKL